MTVPAEVVAAVSRDVANAVEPEDSRLKYTKEMLALREKIQADFDVYRATHPRTVMHIPE